MLSLIILNIKDVNRLNTYIAYFSCTVYKYLFIFAIKVLLLNKLKN